MWKKQSKTKEPENKAKAYEYAVFLLSLQLRTVGEIREKMIGRGYTTAVIENVLGQLIGQKYLDDERYARVFLENLKTYKNLGYYGIKKKFIMKKLPQELIGKILDEGLSLDDELKIAKRFLSHHSPPILGGVRGGKNQDDDDGVQYRTFDEEASKQKQKLTQKLKGKGFRSEVIARLMF